jgi:hypothetical protein
MKRALEVGSSYPPPLELGRLFVKNFLQKFLKNNRLNKGEYARKNGL